MSIRSLKGAPRQFALLGCLLWALFTLFPLYWVAVTSFKTSISVVGGATYIPFVVFEPSLQAWRELFSGEVDQVIAPGTDGEFGVLVDHAPRLHATFGCDVRLFRWDAFGLMDPFDFRLSFTFDGARNYVSYSIGAGMWY